LVQLVIASAVVIALGGVGRLPLPSPLDLPVDWLAGPVAVLWLVTVTNFYNFMDGIDGLAAGQAVASCIGVAVALWSVDAVELALVLAASAVGFLVLNRPPARIFLGDSGSTSLGFAIAGLPLLASGTQRPMALFSVAVGLTLFLIDPIETLWRLMHAGYRVGKAHRSHSYQRLAPTQSRHGAVAGILIAAGLVLAVVGGLAYRTHWLAWPAAALGLVAYIVERFFAGRSMLEPVSRD
jgi:Fuc2NAc and GlcNAc transferase